MKGDTCLRAFVTLKLPLNGAKPPVPTVFGNEGELTGFVGLSFPIIPSWVVSFIVPYTESINIPLPLGEEAILVVLEVSNKLDVNGEYGVVGYPDPVLVTI